MIQLIHNKVGCVQAKLNYIHIYTELYTILNIYVHVKIIIGAQKMHSLNYPLYCRLRVNVFWIRKSRQYFKTTIVV